MRNADLAAGCFLEIKRKTYLRHPHLVQQKQSRKGAEAQRSSQTCYTTIPPHSPLWAFAPLREFIAPLLKLVSGCPCVGCLCRAAKKDPSRWLPPDCR